MTPHESDATIAPDAPDAPDAPPHPLTPEPAGREEPRRARRAALARRFLELVSAYDLDALCALVTPDWAMHGGPPGLPRGPEGVRALFGTFGPIEQTWAVHDVVVEGDRVLRRGTRSGVRRTSRHSETRFTIRPIGFVRGLTAVAEPNRSRAADRQRWGPPR